MYVPLIAWQPQMNHHSMQIQTCLFLLASLPKTYFLFIRHLCPSTSLFLLFTLCPYSQWWSRQFRFGFKQMVDGHLIVQPFQLMVNDWCSPPIKHNLWSWNCILNLLFAKTSSLITRNGCNTLTTHSFLSHWRRKWHTKLSKGWTLLPSHNDQSRPCVNQIQRCAAPVV